ncbi:unnamed protein product [Gadus morhua 'NCC']
MRLRCGVVHLGSDSNPVMVRLYCPQSVLPETLRSASHGDGPDGIGFQDRRCQGRPDGIGFQDRRCQGRPAMLDEVPD